MRKKVNFTVLSFKKETKKLKILEITWQTPKMLLRVIKKGYKKKIKTYKRLLKD